MRGRRRGGRHGGGRSRPSRRAPRDSDEERWDEPEDWDDGDEDDWEEEPAPARRRRSEPSRRSRQERPPRRKGRGGRGDGFDWAAAEEDEFDDRSRADEDDYYEEEEAPRRRRRPRSKAPRQRKSLMQLCTPVFGYAAMLPQDDSGPQPSYEQFRQQVVAALQGIDKDAPANNIEPEDASQAVYALCFFMDSQVAESEWTGKSQWAMEPLGIMMQQDPEGGVNFFKRLDALRDQQRELREVFLVCLALGYRGRFAELPVTEQASRIGEIRQKLIRKIHPTPMEREPELFPEAYREAAPIVDPIQPPPRWWIIASFGAIAVAAVLYLVLFWAAGRSHVKPNEVVEPLLERPSMQAGERRSAGSSGSEVER